MINFPPTFLAIVQRYQRLLVTLLVILLCYFAYAIFRFDIFVWFCETEENAPACTQVGLLAKDRQDLKMAKYYLNQSCEMGYGLGCYRLSEMLSAPEEQELKGQALKKACALRFNYACDQVNDK